MGYGIASNLYEISEKAVKFLGNLSEENRTKLIAFLGREEIPDLQREKWDHRIKMAINEPNIGSKCEEVMKIMFKTGEGDQYSVTTQKMGDRTNLSGVSC